MKLKLPSINPKQLTKEFALRRAKRWSRKNLWPVLNNPKMGPQKVGWLIDNNQPLFKRLLGQPNIPDEWKETIKEAPKYGWAMKLMTYEEIVSLLPDWFGELVKARPNGEVWFTKEVEILSQLLFGSSA